MASQSGSSFVWDDSKFRTSVAIEPLKLLVAPTPLINKDFMTAITTGVSTVNEFISRHELSDKLNSPSHRIDNFPGDPGAAGSPLIEPGFILKDDVDMTQLEGLLSGQSQVILRVLPESEWLEYRLHGAYSQLPQCVGELFMKVAELGYVPAWNDGGFHQHYVTYPPDVDDEGLITDIRVRVVKS